MNPRHRILILWNCLGLAVLCAPAYGFILYMNLNGVLLFLVVACVSVTTMAWILWRHVAETPLAGAYVLTLLSAYLPVVVAWAVALHPLYAPQDFETLGDLGRWGQDAAAIGGLFTAGYWLPASILNCALLRRKTAKGLP